MKYANTLRLFSVIIVIASILTAIGCKQGTSRQILPVCTSVDEAGWYWKPGDFIDYALSGMPDFDQKQDNWYIGAAAPQWTYCGPVTMANSLWWFDSKLEPNPVAPPTVHDGYKMVESYSTAVAAPWDDHDTSNVMPLVNDLAMRMDTDGQKTGDNHDGTNIEDMEGAINQYLSDKDLDNEYYVHVEKSPAFSWIAGEIKRCQDVVLLLGFWQYQTDPTHNSQGEWVRVGGHYVTCAGVNTDTTQLAIADPYRDNAEAGNPGRVPASHAYPHNSSAHNDAKYLSHDIFNISQSTSPGGLWKFDGYADGFDVANFVGQNWAADLLNYQGSYNPNLTVQVEIDYAIAVSPFEKMTPTVPPPTPTPTPMYTPPPLRTPTPTATPSRTSKSTPTPSPTPFNPSGREVTGIDATHALCPNGELLVNIFVHESYYPNGTNIWDVHFYLSDGTLLGSSYFNEPLATGRWYQWVLEYTGDKDLGHVYVLFTDESHAVWGRVITQSVPCATPTPSARETPETWVQPGETPVSEGTPQTETVLYGYLSLSQQCTYMNDRCVSCTVTADFYGQDLTAGEYPVTGVVLTANGQTVYDSGSISASLHQNQIAFSATCGTTYNMQLTVTNSIGLQAVVTKSFTAGASE